MENLKEEGKIIMRFKNVFLIFSFIGIWYLACAMDMSDIQNLEERKSLLSWKDLPPDITFSIAKLTKIKDGIVASEVCKTWYTTWNSGAIWKHYAERIPRGLERVKDHAEDYNDPFSYNGYKTIIRGLMSPCVSLLGEEEEKYGYEVCGVSGDGKVVLGLPYNSVDCRAFIWTEKKGMKSLDNLDKLNGSQTVPCININALSMDGKVVVGGARDGQANEAERAFIWTEDEGMKSLGVLNGGQSSSATGVSADGKVVVGGATDGQANNAQRAFIWTEDEGMKSLGALNGGWLSSPTAISADGKVVVGGATDGQANHAQRAFIWTEEEGMKSLGALNGGWSSSPTAVSADCKVVVGLAADGQANNAERAFIWTEKEGMKSLGALNGGWSSSATAVSADGKVVVGLAADGQANNAERAFIWTEKEGMESLGVLNKGGWSSSATAVSADGKVVVGSARYDKTDHAQRVFIWTEQTGMLALQNILENTLGINAPEFQLDNTVGLSSDGTIIVGASIVDDESTREDFTISCGWRAYVPRFDIFKEEKIDLLKKYKSKKKKRKREEDLFDSTKRKK
jgi:probable HAF family extracellular repeat protein